MCYLVCFSFLTSSRALGAKGFRITWTEIHEAGNIIYHFQTNGIMHKARCNKDWMVHCIKYGEPTDYDFFEVRELAKICNR